MRYGSRSRWRSTAFTRRGPVGRAQRRRPPAARCLFSRSTGAKSCRFCPWALGHRGSGTVRDVARPETGRNRDDHRHHQQTRPARTCRRGQPGPPTKRRRRASRTWAWSGVAAGVLAIGTMVSSSTINAVYDKAITQSRTPSSPSWPTNPRRSSSSRSSPASPRWPGRLRGSASSRAGRPSRRQHRAMVASAGLSAPAVVTVLGSGLGSRRSPWASRTTCSPPARSMFRPPDGHHPVVQASSIGLSALAHHEAIVMVRGRLRQGLTRAA